MAFHQAGVYHQNYSSRYLGKLYIVLHDAPKVAALSKRLPDLYVETMAKD